MAIKITREARDAIYAEIRTDLAGTGDIQLEFDNGDYEAARRHRRRFEDDMRLLDDLGWESEQDGEELEITMPTQHLHTRVAWPQRPMRGRCCTAHIASSRLPSASRLHDRSSLRPPTEICSPS